MTVSGTARMLVGLNRGFPKFGVFSLSSRVMLCIVPTFTAGNPSKVGEAAAILGQVWTVGTKLPARALGLKARLPLLGALCLRWPKLKHCGVYPAFPLAVQI